MDDKDRKIIELLIASGREPATSISEKIILMSSINLTMWPASFKVGRITE